MPGCSTAPVGISPITSSRGGTRHPRAGIEPIAPWPRARSRPGSRLRAVLSRFRLLTLARNARLRFARALWRKTKPFPGTIAERYLTARGVGHVAVAPALRFSPSLSHPHAPGRFPCLVAGVQDAHGGFLGVQRTYLDSTGDGKANVEPARASLGSLSGGAVRLAEPEHGRPLVVGEGIESTAGAALLFDAPGWAALGTSGLRAIELPEHVRDVVIAADRDADGLRAAAALARRLEAEDRAVEIRRPCKGDFNDALNPPASGRLEMRTNRVR